MIRIASVTISTLWLYLLSLGAIVPAATVSLSDKDDTLLMFVGEDLGVLSIASRREESAWQAPAVARVITGDELREQGIRTLGHALEMVPGFYMVRKEWGTQPYLRGIPNPVLFLYDTIPLGSDISKSFHPLDHELSLAPIKRIEIVRGPGSVLWGPDAFAGIVNVVPMTGKDLDGMETGILYGGPGNQGAAYVNMGHNADQWDAFLSVSGRSGEEDDSKCNIVKFWGPIPYEERFGENEPGRSHYLEVSGNFSFRDWFTVSTLFSDYERSYAMSDDSGDIDLTWPESRSGPFGFIKLEGKKDLDRFSALRFTGAYTWLDPEYEIIDRTLEQKERTSYGEVIYDRSFLTGKGLFTSGLSFRKKQIENAPIWKGYFPDFLGQEDDPVTGISVPIIEEKDYDTNLRSLFGQYTHMIGDIDLWLGLRYDDHDVYKDHMSYNTGISWSPSAKWMLKLLYGTAYRTPYARQLLKWSLWATDRLEDEPELENIKTLSMQIVWQPSGRASLSLCGFSSKIKDHVMEDPYAGLSQRNSQDIKGVEIQGHISPLKGLDLSANLSLMDNSGPDETYHYFSHFEEGDPGEWVPVYEDRSYPFDAGPSRLFNLMGTWQPIGGVSLFGRLSYSSSRQLIFPGAEDFPSIPGAWLLDMSAVIRDIVMPGLDLEFSLRNLTDKQYETVGTYTVIEGEPFSAEIMLRMRW
ncbi:MAG: TonB-dependent receptor [Desulfobacterales bacterium]|nr:TonB-dependent receptor [Desulfobacterales bacterium]